MFTFMVKVVFKKSEISGYPWMDGTPANLDCFVEVSADTLQEAIDKVLEVYNDKSKYWVQYEGSYMKLKPLN